MCRRHDDDRLTAWQRHDDDMTTMPRRCDDGATTVISLGSASNPSLSLWHVMSPGSAPNPGLYPGLWHVKLGLVTVVALSSHRRHVVKQSSCRRSITVVPSAHRRRAAELSSSGRRHIVVVPSSPSSYRPVVIFHIPLAHVFWIMLINIYIYIDTYVTLGILCCQENMQSFCAPSRGGP